MANTTKRAAPKAAAGKSVSPKAKKSAGRKSSGARAEAEPLLKEFFVDEIKDIYWAEKKLVTTLPKMRKAATTPELQDAFTEHLEVTKEHVNRLEQVFEMLGEKAQAKKCEAMEGLVKEGEGIIEDTEDGSTTRDVALIMAAQKVEHYEIATYGGLTQLAKTLGLDDVAEILFSTLEEEKQADETLTGIAENSVNYEAALEGEEEEEPVEEEA
ncbi:MAG: ferritin-like domain-containing protein [Chitinophagaceae bacterium]|nr:ferritin-like domain-containing protein [Chitinophagaceae bacterium]